MSLSINTNLASIVAQNALSATNDQQKVSMERLSSGLRVNSAADDAAGLAISDSMTSQIRGTTVALRNVNDGISLLQVADGATSNIVSNLQRIRELAIQAANGIYSDSDRQAMQTEVSQLLSENFAIQSRTTFNDMALFDGSYTNKSFQVGANSDEYISVSLPKLFSPSTVITPGYTIPAVTQTTTTTTTVPTSYVANIQMISGFPTMPVSAAIKAGDLSLNGKSIQPSVAGTQPGQTADSAWAIEQAIINSSAPGVIVTPTLNSTIGQIIVNNSDPGTTIPAGGISINGFPLPQISAPDMLGMVNAVMTQVNLLTSSTGVSAGVDYFAGQSYLYFTAVDNRNINIQESSPGYASMAGVSPVGITRGALYIGTASAPTPQGDLIISGNNPLNAGLTAGTWVADTSGPPLTTTTTTTTVITPAIVVPPVMSPGEATSDVLTQSNALQMINYTDSKINSVNSVRADVGALQNRFSAIIPQLASYSENLSAAKSRIVDTDYAKETAALARSQILKQSGAAILAQANSSQLNVLNLLKSF